MSYWPLNWAPGSSILSSTMPSVSRRSSADAFFHDRPTVIGTFVGVAVGGLLLLGLLVTVVWMRCTREMVHRSPAEMPPDLPSVFRAPSRRRPFWASDTPSSRSIISAHVAPYAQAQVGSKLLSGSPGLPFGHKTNSAQLSATSPMRTMKTGGDNGLAAPLVTAAPSAINTSSMIHRPPSSAFTAPNLSSPTISRPLPPFHKTYSPLPVDDRPSTLFSAVEAQRLQNAAVAHPATMKRSSFPPLLWSQRTSNTNRWSRPLNLRQFRPVSTLLTGPITPLVTSKDPEYSWSCRSVSLSAISAGSPGTATLPRSTTGHSMSREPTTREGAPRHQSQREESASPRPQRCARLCNDFSHCKNNRRLDRSHPPEVLTEAGLTHGFGDQDHTSSTSLVLYPTTQLFDKSIVVRAQPGNADTLAYLTNNEKEPSGMSVPPAKSPCDGTDGRPSLLLPHPQQVLDSERTHLPASYWLDSPQATNKPTDDLDKRIESMTSRPHLSMFGTSLAANDVSMGRHELPIASSVPPSTGTDTSARSRSKYKWAHWTVPSSSPSARVLLPNPPRNNTSSPRVQLFSQHPLPSVSPTIVARPPTSRTGTPEYSDATPMHALYVTNT